jgi:anti-anti-sigma regulatory factor
MSGFPRFRADDPGSARHAAPLASEIVKVLIVGAGIGGLATALFLHEAGIESEIYERSPEIRELGVGINALPLAVGPLAGLGLLDRLDEVAIRTKELFYCHRLGQVIMHRPCGLDAGFDVPQLSVHRGRLQGVLLRAVRERRARAIVIDVTGVPEIDSTAANQLIGSVTSARMMGAETIISGLSAEIAQTLVTVGIDLSLVVSAGDLEGGIELAERHLAGVA